MKQSFGPWATAINPGSNPRLSTFWKRRMELLKTTHSSRLVLSRKAVFALVVAGLVSLMLPTVRSESGERDDLNRSEPVVARKPADEIKLAEAEAVYQELTQATHWREASELSKRLAKMGRVSIPFLLKGIEHDNRDTRWYSFSRLQHDFPKEPELVEAMIRLLKEKRKDEKYARLCYSSTFLLGTWKIEGAREVLWEIYQVEPDLKIYAAKSLAELGEKKVLHTLYQNLSHDRYMMRYPANVGFKALSGKDLNDLNLDYKWQEGAFVSGGREMIGPLRPIDTAEQRAQRYLAIAEYCKWLKKSRPDLYKALEGKF